MDAVALVAELVEEEKATEADTADDGRQADERDGGGCGERDLDDGIVGAAVGVEGEGKVGEGRDGESQNDKEEPGDGSVPAA